MRSYSVRIIFLLSMLMFLAGCSATDQPGDQGAQSPCDQSSDVKGMIVTVSPQSVGTNTNYTGSIFVDGTKMGQQGQLARVSTRIDADTQIFVKESTGCRSTSFAALKTGQQVMVISTGIASLSSPPQITATRIIILATDH